MNDRENSYPVEAERLDVCVARILNTSREEARLIIKGGHVLVNGKILDKPGMRHYNAETLTITGGRRPFVSRGGEKLAAALAYFNISLQARVCLDVGASTGGFTDCMLQNGAAKVYAVENGTGQLAQVLRNDPRVTWYEQTDIRAVTPGFFEALSFAAVDVSFISLTLVLTPVVSLLAEGASLVCLIKPQFEAGPGKVNKHGVVTEECIRQDAVKRVTDHAVSLGFKLNGVIPSPLLGSGGNREFLLYATKSEM